MINAEYILLHLPLTIVFAVFFFTSLPHGGGKGRHDRSFFFLACMFVWQGLELLFFFMESPSAITFFYSLKHLPLLFLPVAFFHHTTSFYRIKRYIPRWALVALLGVPVVVSILSLIPFTASYFAVYNGEGHGYGPLYIIALANAYVAAAAAGITVVYMYIRLPGAYHRGSIFHLALLFILVVSQAIYQSADIWFDMQYYGLSLCGVLFYCAHLINSDTSSLSIDKSSVFDFLDQAIFILNEDGVIVEVNQPAFKWLRSMKRSVEHVAFDGLLSVLSNNNRIVIKELEDSDDSDIHVVGSAIPLIYRMERRQFVMSDGIGKGEFITLSDVTRNRLIIDRLRDMAGIDGLTGTANRYRYQDLLRKLDRADNYPLAVVIGDVNGLKTINDTLGHAEGDQYLLEIASALMQCCPRGGHVARYGGDEFATLLVNASADAVESYIKAVDKSLSAERKDGSPQPSIALGYAIKHHGNENLNTLIGQADKKMYDDKMARKAAEREALSHA
ncbi:MAG: diguanylate cyclase [Oscillospiraceae bacterium]|nr:diguanylate cyclase [Oscillospiraceae bacterium]